MQLFFCHSAGDGQVILNDEETRHLKVLRKQIGDRINCIDGKGHLILSEILSIKKDSCELNIVSSQLMPLERQYHLHLYIAPTKNADRIEWMLEKSVEAGIDAITFIETQHSEKNKVNLQRMERIAVSALKQSSRYYLPEINPIVTLDKVDPEGKILFAHCEEAEKITLADLFRKDSPKGEYSVFIGPEGDFSETEISTMLSKSYTPLSLGTGRLRTETAGLYIAMVFNALS